MKIIFIWLAALALTVTTAYARSAPITLIWQIDPEGFCEGDWIREILAGVAYEEAVDGRLELVKHNAIVVLSVAGAEPLNRYFQKFIDNNCKFGVIQLSDEHYNTPTEFYPQAAFVFRNYWHSKFNSQKNVFTFPLGYMHGFWRNYQHSELPAAYRRHYVWSFAGQIENKPTRAAMVKHLRKITPNFVHAIKAFRGSNSLPVTAYRDLLLNSVFVPCPCGFVNLDSFRLYEALECGCIPIVERGPDNYFANFLGDYPFLTVDSWAQASSMIRELRTDPFKVEQLRQSCYTWWQEYKKNMKTNMTAIVERAFSD